MKALIAITKPECSNKILEILQNQSIETFLISDFDQIQDVFNKTSPNYLIIDSQVLKTLGFEKLDLIKKRNLNSLVIIMVDLENSTDFLLNAYKNGIDDFVNWPFVSELFMYKVKALGARIGDYSKSTAFYPSLDLEINSSSHQARIKGQGVELTKTEFKILKEVALQADNVIPRNQLLDKVFDSFVNSSRTMDVHIHNLRKKLSLTGLRIETIRGVGCRLRKSDNPEV